MIRTILSLLICLTCVDAAVAAPLCKDVLNSRKVKNISAQYKNPGYLLNAVFGKGRKGKISGKKTDETFKSKFENRDWFLNLESRTFAMAIDTHKSSFVKETNQLIEMKAEGPDRDTEDFGPRPSAVHYTLKLELDSDRQPIKLVIVTHHRDKDPWTNDSVPNETTYLSLK